MNFKEQQEFETSSSKGKNKVKKVHVTTKEAISIEQLKDLVEDRIKAKKESGSKSSFTYSKPYTTKIDNLLLAITKIQQFNGKGNLKQHIAHFIETCNNVGRSDVCMDLM